MNSVESLRLDFNSQIKLLNNIHKKKLFDDCIYVGSGDSYVAGLIVEYLTSHKCRCYSPSDLLKARLLEDKTYCFISVTGRTKANIELARHATKSGIRTVAVTFNENSKLAQVCKEVVPVNLTKMDTPTAGFGTFVANVVTCLQISGIMIPKKFQIWHREGVKLSMNILNSTVLPANTLFLLGNNVLFAIALYGSLQMAEFFGATAIAHKLEEFCHSPIFGFKKPHNIWILGQKEKPLSMRLEKLGINVSYFELYNHNILAQLFQSIFFAQSLVLLLAERHGYTELQYLLNDGLLRASSDLIYDV